MKSIALMFFSVCAAFGQQTQPSNTKPELLRLTDELDGAIQSGDWNKAIALSHSLKDSTVEARNRSLAKGGVELVDQILQWLPPDTETLIVAQQPFKVPSEKPKTIEGVSVMAQGYALGLFGTIEKESIAKVLGGRTIRLAALGARKFANHTPDARGALPLGLIAYQGCAVYSFVEEVPESVFQRKADESVMGHPVWVSKGSQNDFQDTDTYFAGLPKPDLMLTCNDRDFFTQMVSRMAVGQPARALPADLKEWQHLDRSAPVWAIRHFRSDRAGEDPTIAELLAGKGPEAVGLTVAFGIDGGAKATMLAKSDPWGDLAKVPEFREVWPLAVPGMGRGSLPLQTRTKRAGWRSSC
jgi:hypothetical protein